jgi:hypothetical protein
VEKEAAIMAGIEQQARHFLEVLHGDSEFSLQESADELLLFLIRITDGCRTRVEFTSPLHAISDIIQGLESNPVATLDNPAMRERLCAFLKWLLKSSKK